MLLMIDNYDSFTYNIVQYLSELGADVEVVRNDQISLDEIKKKQPEKIVISPGPGTPNDSGISLLVVAELGHHIPILGVCLGHQVIAQVFGAKISQAGAIMHGKPSMIHHCEQGLFADLANPFQAIRYHSLAIDKNTMPECLQATAWTLNEDGTTEEIMGLRHAHYPLVGVQFHPESIMTDYGHELLNNFLHHEL